jgi:hypothetical protein
MLEGRKTCTSRTRRIGQQGDIFVAFGKLFEIVHVDQMTVGEIAARLYCEEGFDSREAFLEELARIYPRTGRNPDAHMWVHKFVRMDATT